MERKYDVCGIGSALMDLIFEVDDSVLEEIGLKKGEMHLIDKEKSKDILNKLENAKTCPGGSSANTLAGVAMLGGNAVFLGKIGKDEHGEAYESKTKEHGVNTNLSKHDNEMTGHAITLITPDAERTFATHLGSSLHLKKEDITEEDIKESKILHIEGYQLEGDVKEAALHAMEIAKKNNVLISIDLADPAFVKRNLESLKEITKEYADIIFANENEAKAFTGKDEEEALHEISNICKIAAVKLGERGSLIKRDGKVHIIPINVVNVVNTNGAGDAYAAGILYSIAKDINIEKAGKIASFISSKVVASSGARVEKNLKEEIKNF